MRRRGRLVALLLAPLLALGLAACAAAPSGEPGGGSPGAPASSAPLPSGSRGAVDFDGGYLQVGSGATVVDVYFDFLCPLCGAFERANGETLRMLAQDGGITLRLHPMTFLDRSSQGTRYSTRAAAALVCVGVEDQDRVFPFFSSLYAHQPEEDSAGLSDAQLVRLAEDAGASISPCVKDGRYRAWVQAVNARALSGPIPGADIQAIQGTPTILVNGHSFTGDPTVAGPLEGLLRAQAAG